MSIDVLIHLLCLTDCQRYVYSLYNVFCLLETISSLVSLLISLSYQCFLLLILFMVNRLLIKDNLDILDSVAVEITSTTYTYSAISTLQTFVVNISNNFSYCIVVAQP